MRKFAFLFPGQGSQFAGMGKTLADSFPEAKAVFDEADDALGFGLSKLCFEGPEEALKLTENTQPALLTVSIAALRVLEARGFAAEVVSGHSLGEYSALVAAGALLFADAVRLVRKRGRFMQKAVAPGVGTMAALLKLPPGALDPVLAGAAQGEVVTAANFNSPDQVVIAGHVAAVKRATDLARAAGAKRAVMLPVSAPFHSPLMKPAQDAMRPELDSTTFCDLRIPLINNWEAREIRTGVEAREGLFHQIPGAVRWAQAMTLLSNYGVTECIETGAGSVLTGLLRTIRPELKCHKFGEAEDLRALGESLG